jgi:hypothetical protein
MSYSIKIEPTSVSSPIAAMSSTAYSAPAQIPISAPTALPHIFSPIVAKVAIELSA